MDPKKYPALTAVVGLLGLACLGGIGLTAWQGIKYSSNKSGLSSADGKLQRLLRSDIAPTEENVKAAEANFASTQAYEQKLFAGLQGDAGRNLNAEFKDGAGDLKAILQETSTKLTKAIEAAGVRIYKPRDFGLGFTRYVSGGSTPKNEYLTDVATEDKVIFYLVSELLAAKENKDMPLVLQAVQREPIELVQVPGQAPQKDNSDEYKPKPNETLRREGVLKTLYFRLQFTAKTDLLRRFINSVRGSGYPIVIRGVEVAPAKADALKPPSDAFGNHEGDALPPGFAEGAAAPLPPGFEAPHVEGAAPAAPPPPPAQQTIVKDDASEFTISFEYLIPVKPTPVAADAGNANN